MIQTKNTKKIGKINSKNAKNNEANTKVNKKSGLSDKNKTKDKSILQTLSIFSAIKDFDVIRKTYELPEENLTLTMVLHKMSETLEFYLKIVQQILQPEEFHALYECNAFNDVDKEKLFDLYKNMIIVHREALKAIVSADEKSIIVTINYMYEKINTVKPQMIEIINKMQKSWSDKKDVKKSRAQYFG